jgi:hypothetical protein
MTSLRKPTARKAKPQKADAPNKSWEWAPFTKKAVEFTQSARALASALKLAYGDNVSISQYEKLVSAVPSMTDDQRALLHVDKKIVALYRSYRTARAIRDSERDNFRGDIKISNVDTGLEALDKLESFNEGFGYQEKEEKEKE